MATETTTMRKVNNILISQPEPANGKSPYYDLAKKYNIKVDFRKFIQVDGIEAKEFRRQKIDPNAFTAIILTSRNAVDHFFRICEELRIKVSQDMKYICSSEAIALYLQKYIVYRKRKVSFGTGRDQGMRDLLKKYKKDKILWPCGEETSSSLPEFLEEKGYDYTMGQVYRTVSSDLSDLEKLTYDVIVFFSPLGLKSLYENFPNFKQNKTRIAGWGQATAEAIRDAGLTLNIQAPVPDVPSMAMALDLYLEKSNKK